MRITTLLAPLVVVVMARSVGCQMPTVPIDSAWIALRSIAADSNRVEILVSSTGAYSWREVRRGAVIIRHGRQGQLSASALAELRATVADPLMQDFPGCVSPAGVNLDGDSTRFALTLNPASSAQPREVDWNCAHNASAPVRRLMMFLRMIPGGLEPPWQPPSR